MRNCVTLLIFISGLGYAQTRYKSENTVKIYLKKLNLSIEGGYFNQQFYYKGDQNKIDPFPFPIIDAYLKVRLGYALSPKLSAEYAFTTFKYSASIGWKNTFTFISSSAPYSPFFLDRKSVV